MHSDFRPQNPHLMSQQNQILYALDNIITKMDNQIRGEVDITDKSALDRQKFVVLEDENVNETSLDKSKIVLESLQTPTGP